MALSTPFAGTGEFVPERVWSCPVHDRDVADYEECDPWLHEGEVCLDCVTGVWSDKRGVDGNVVMREVGEMEYWATHMIVARSAEFKDGLIRTLLGAPSSEMIVQWDEDSVVG